jgi:putative addiction module component (TIGR02574 family)
MSPFLLAEALKLSVPERIELAEAIWDTVAADAETFPLTEAEKAELDLRLADLKAAPDAGSPWEEVRARLERDR